MNTFFKLTRYMIVLPVIGSFLAALATICYGTYKVILVITEIFQGIDPEKAIKVISVSFIEVIDLFLVGTVFYIIAMGLYELFIDDRLELPDWLVIHHLDDLKSKLISGIVVIMSVYFLGVLVLGDPKIDLLRTSIAIGIMIAALSFFQFIKSKTAKHE
jgi:uncharacterized membrane protein YqhA